MALSDGWFQNWQPPDFLDQPLSLNNNTSYGKKEDYQNFGTNFFLPLFLGLVPPQSLPKQPSSHNQNRHHYHDDNDEVTGPFTTLYAWKEVDFAYETPEEREYALSSKEFIPKNNLPLGLAIHDHRIFVSMPKWKDGVPATLAVLPRKPRKLSPAMVPYPNWAIHRTDSCEGLTSVFRMQVDSCDRLWVLDSGQIHVTVKPEQVCPPALYIFDLKTDELLLRYPLPDKFIKQDSLYSNIAIDLREGDCVDVHAYLTDVWRYGIVVFSLKRMRSWRITDHLFYPEPLAAAYNVHGLEYQWTDGIFGMALSPINPKNNERLLYFHPMSSFREFWVKTSVICNETGWSDVKGAFKVMGQSRGKNGHASASGMDRNGIMFFNMVTRDQVGCWDSRKPYKRSNLGVVAESEESLLFPNDLKVDLDKRQSVWVLSNRLPYYLYRTLDKNNYNFRVLSAYTDEAIKGTICDPNVRYHDSYEEFDDEEDCY